VHKAEVIIQHSFCILQSFKVVENSVPERELEIRDLGKKENEEANFGSKNGIEVQGEESFIKLQKQKL